MATASATRTSVEAAADQLSRAAKAVDQSSRATIEATSAASRATLAMFDAFSDYCLAALDAGLKYQARTIDTSKMMLDQSVALERAGRKMVEELLENARAVQQATCEAAGTIVSAGLSAGVPANGRRRS